MDGLTTVCTHNPFQDLTQSISGRGMYRNNVTQPEGLHMIVRKKQTLGGERGGGGTENNRRGRLLKHTSKFTQWSYLCDFCAKSNRMRKLTHRKSSATHPAPSQSIVTIVSLHDDKQQQDWPPDEESTRTLVRCFEWANVVLRKPLGSHSPCTKLKTHYSEQLHCYNDTLLIRWFGASTRFPKYPITTLIGDLQYSICMM